MSSIKLFVFNRTNMFKTKHLYIRYIRDIIERYIFLNRVPLMIQDIDAPFENYLKLIIQLQFL